jgi:hypothetical protein
MGAAPQKQGYFTTHNVRFNAPLGEHYVSKDESVPSNIDVAGPHLPYWTRPSNSRHL